MEISDISFVASAAVSRLGCPLVSALAVEGDEAGLGLLLSHRQMEPLAGCGKREKWASLPSPLAGEHSLAIFLCVSFLSPS